MTSLNGQQKQLLFDYCIGLTSEAETAQAEALISSSEEAVGIHSKLKSALAPLDSISSEPCPDELAERTIWRLNNAARSSQPRLQQLLATEQGRDVSTKSRFWPSLGKRLATAAVFMIVGTILITMFRVITSYARQKSWQHQCKMQLSRLFFEGVTQYASDHDGKLPAVAAPAGEPWWKVGYQGSENHSNTRPLWLLVKLNYVDPADFVCPGGKDANIAQLTASQIKNYSDFPGRKYMTYSFRIRCREAADEKLLCRKILMADLSPLFERLPEDYSQPFKPLRLDKKLLTLNSINHKRRGQNVLFGDGRVEFIRTRHTGISEDDIFTLQNTDIYQGCEVPSCETDTFLAP